MSDRVKFLLVNVAGVEPQAPGYNGGRSSGISGWPFPWMPGTDDGIRTTRALTLATADKDYGKVNQWRLTGSIVMTYQSPFGTPQTATAVFAGTNIDFTTGIGAPTRESDLVYEQSLFGTATAINAWTSTDAGTPVGNMEVSLELFASTGIASGADYARIVRDYPTSNYYASMTFTAAFDGLINHLVIGTNNVGATSDAAPQDNFTLDGMTCPIGRSDSGTSVTACSLVLVPNRYWAYAAEDGSPIYNATTGATIQNPLN